MNRDRALKQLRLMQAWHEDNGDGPNADYDAICFAIETIERSEDLEKLITALEQEHAKLREMQSATDINVGTTDTISRQAAIDALAKGNWGVDWDKALAEAIIKDMPPAHPEKDVLAWLLAYHTESFNLHGRYLAHEVIGWLIADFSKQYMQERRTDG